MSTRFAPLAIAGGFCGQAGGLGPLARGLEPIQVSAGGQGRRPGWGAYQAKRRPSGGAGEQKKTAGGLIHSWGIEADANLAWLKGLWDRH